MLIGWFSIGLINNFLISFTLFFQKKWLILFMWKIMFYRKSVCYSITSSNSSMKMNVRLRDFSDNEQKKTIFKQESPSRHHSLRLPWSRERKGSLVTKAFVPGSQCQCVHTFSTSHSFETIFQLSNIKDRVRITMSRLSFCFWRSHSITPLTCNAETQLVTFIYWFVENSIKFVNNSDLDTLFYE